MKGIEILIFKGFGKIYVCEIHGKRTMVWHNNYT
jgi:hypothetical protein